VTDKYRGNLNTTNEIDIFYCITQYNVFHVLLRAKKTSLKDIQYTHTHTHTHIISLTKEDAKFRERI